MSKKVVASVAEALSGLNDGSQIMVGGFGLVGQPDILVEGIVELGIKDLTLVMNGAGQTPGRSVSLLLELRRVRKMICSFPRSIGCNLFSELYAAGEIELELVPQGTLGERIRAAGAGIGAFFTPTAAGTLLAEGKEQRELHGVPQVLEMPIFADVALIHAWRSDTIGNLTYRGTGRNFNPLMAMAGDLTIVQTNHLVDLGQMDPETIITPGIYVDRIVHVPDVIPAT